MCRMNFRNRRDGLLQYNRMLETDYIHFKPPFSALIPISIQVHRTYWWFIVQYNGIVNPYFVMGCWGAHLPQASFTIKRYIMKLQRTQLKTISSKLQPIVDMRFNYIPTLVLTWKYSHSLFMPVNVHLYLSACQIDVDRVLPSNMFGTLGHIENRIHVGSKIIK